MNSFLTIMLAVIMAFAPLGGSTVKLDEPISFDVSMKLDAEAVMALASDTGAEIPEETQRSFKAIGDILNAITFEGVVANDAVELSVLTGESSVLSAGVKYNDDGAVIASSLLGSQVVTVTDETIRKMQEEQMNSAAQSMSFADYRSLMDAMRQLDKEQIEKDCVEAGDKLAAAIEQKKGETETGEFTVDGMIFTGKTPVSVTSAEFVELLLNSFKELVQKDSLKPITQNSGKEIAVRIDEMIENLKESPEEQQPKLELAIYTDANGSAYYVCDMSDPEDSHPISEPTVLHVGFGDVQGKKHIQASLTQDGQEMVLTAIGVPGGKGNLKATITSKDSNSMILANTDGAGNTDMVCSITSKEASAIITASSVVKNDGRTGFTMNLYFGNPEKPLLTVTGSSGKGGSPVSVYEGDDITVTSLEDLKNDETGDAITPVKMTLVANAMMSVTTLTKNLPADTTAWIAEQIRKLGSSSLKKTTPTSQPVVDGE